MDSNSPTVGLIGCGRWGRHILRDLRLLGCTVHVVARSAASVERAGTGGAKLVTPRVDDLGDVEGVVVATPTPRHADDVESLLALDVPVFVEKPLCTDPATAESLAVRAPSRLFVMDKWRYHPGVEALRDIARSGELGAVVGLRTVRHGWGNPHADVDDVWVLLPHDLAIGLEILGAMAPIRSAVAEGTPDEMTGLIAVAGDRPWHVIDVSGTAHQRRRVVQLVCAEGTAWLADGYAEAVGVARANRVGEEPEWRRIDSELPLLRELRAFVGHLRGGAAPKSSAAEAALAVQRIAEARRLAAGLSEDAAHAGIIEQSLEAGEL